MDRRRFLIHSARLVGASVVLPWAQAFAQIPSVPDTTKAAADFPDLALAKGAPRDATHKVLKALGGIERFVLPGQVIVVKPNASFESPPEWGATTHPEVLAATLEACFEAGAKRVLVLDHAMSEAKRCFERTGIADAVSGFPKAKLVSLDKEKMYREIPVPSGKALHKVHVPVALRKADVFINLPTAKSHASTGVSLGLKNLMGLVWDRHRFHSDMDLHMGIADLATVLRPHLTILDAITLLRTGGPSGPGDVDSFNGVIAGVDPLAVDAYGVGLSPWNGRTYRPHQVAYIRNAAKHGLGNSKPESLRIKDVS